jgi:hypothetical protein
MDDRILKVKLVPSWNSPDIRNLLRRSLSNFELLWAGIAYWMVDNNMFGRRAQAQTRRGIISAEGYSA